jgi:hypothetical protein
MNEQSMIPQGLNPETLNLRDIHLPEAISWWPLAPGWWIIAGATLLFIIVFFVSRKISRKTYRRYKRSRQLKRDIKSELEHIKQHYKQTQNESALAKSLSILLRRASISYYPAKDTAGLTGDDWLSWLDTGNTKNTGKRFQSNIGKMLLTAPYIAEDSKLDFDTVVAHGCAVMSRKDGISQRAMDGGAIYGPKDGVVAQGCAVYGPKDGQKLIDLCEFWLHSSHKKNAGSN